MKSSVKIKEESVNFISEKIEKNSAIYMVDFLGLTVEEINDLRKKLRAENVFYKVYKNTLVARAFKKNGIEGIDKYLVGATAFAVCEEDEVAPARILAEFAKKNKKDLPRFKVGVLNGSILMPDELEAVAKLPTKQALLSMLASSLNAPTVKFAQTLQSCVTSIAYAVNAVKEQKESEENK